MFNDQNTFVTRCILDLGDVVAFLLENQTEFDRLCILEFSSVSRGTGKDCRSTAKQCEDCELYQDLARGIRGVQLMCERKCEENLKCRIHNTTNAAKSMERIDSAIHRILVLIT